MQKLEMLRDDAISRLRNRKISFDLCEARGGPTAGTLQKWYDKKVREPRMSTFLAIADVLGEDIGFVSRKR